MMSLFRALMIMALAGSSVNALEASAGADTVHATQMGINAKIEAGNAAITAVINQMLACNRDKKFFDSVSGSCESSSAGDAFSAESLEKLEIYTETKTVAVPLSCNDFQKFANCSVSFNLANYLPAGVSADSVMSSIEISWGVNRTAGKNGCNGGPTCPLRYAQTFTMPNLRTNVSAAAITFEKGSDSSGNTRYAKTDWQVTGGVVTLTGESCRSTNLYSAAVANIVVKFNVLKLRPVPTS